MSFIELKDVHKNYKMGDVTIAAANGINFEVEEGELAIIVGPSGSGKTTILNILGGMDTADTGIVKVGDSDIAKFNKKQLIAYRRHDIGFVFQFYNLIQNLTAKENVELSTQLSADSLDASEVLADVGLNERLNNFPAQLSGGEQQRVAIARALAKRPKLLLCDEPTGALDYNTGKKVLVLLQQMCIKTGMTVVLVTHNTAIAPMADRVISLKNGAVESVKLNKNPADINSIEW